MFDVVYIYVVYSVHNQPIQGKDEFGFITNIYGFSLLISLLNVLIFPEPRCIKIYWIL